MHHLLKNLAPAVCAAVLLSVAAERAASADPSVSDKAAAETLFVEGRKALTAGKFAEACKAFSDSQRLDPGVGTLLNLGRCYEKLGKTASAWTTYREAASAARIGHQPAREKNARIAAEALEPKLAKFSIQVMTPEKVPNLQIVRDGENLPQTLWGVAAAIDPGPHEIEALAPGFKPWRTRITAEVGKTGSMSVPTLEPLPAEVASRPAAKPAKIDSPPVPAAQPDQVSQTNGVPAQKVIGLVAIGAGVISTGVGSYFALQAKSKYATSFGDGLCISAQDNRCTDAGLAVQDKSRSYAALSTATMAAGAVAVATGVVLWITAPSGSSSDSTPPTAASKSRVWVSAEPIGETRSVTLSGVF